MENISSDLVSLVQLFLFIFFRCVSQSVKCGLFDMRKSLVDEFCILYSFNGILNCSKNEFLSQELKRHSIFIAIQFRNNMSDNRANLKTSWNTR